MNQIQDLMSFSPTGNYSLAVGVNCSVTRGYSAAIGQRVTVEHENSFAFGQGSCSTNEHQMVIGKNNKLTNDDGVEKAFIIGNGTDVTTDKRSNALTVDWAGNLVCNNIPAAPTADGNYVLKCSIVSGVPTYSWVAEQ